MFQNEVISTEKFAFSHFPFHNYERTDELWRNAGRCNSSLDERICDKNKNLLYHGVCTERNDNSSQLKFAKISRETREADELGDQCKNVREISEMKLYKSNSKMNLNCNKNIDNSLSVNDVNTAGFIFQHDCNICKIIDHTVFNNSRNYVSQPVNNVSPFITEMKEQHPFASFFSVLLKTIKFS